MRMTDILWVGLIFLVLSSSCAGLVGNSLRQNRKAEELKMQADSLKFISESFRNTCHGKGFNSLGEWQKTCRALWNLDYIGWSLSDDFMIDEVKNEGELYYGKWIKGSFEGEVYSRRKNE